MQGSNEKEGVSYYKRGAPFPACRRVSALMGELKIVQRDRVNAVSGDEPS